MLEKRVITVDGESIHLEIQDTSGQERYRSICAQYYSRTDGIIVAYSIVDKDSFNELDKWCDQIKTNAPPDVCLVLVGCKEDLKQERKVSYDEGLKYAEQNNMLYIETSSQTGYNVKELFELISWAIKDNGVADKKPRKESITIKKKIKNKPIEKQDCWC